ncbi:MAG: CHC2 zinc finger domain-containing protein, partial [Chloroflexi bacterium]|nr:CHC2 zinc finger domain-containing protein [Chloroflexota bacterium]
MKSRIVIADLVAETVALRKAGTTLKGLCPFHQEKTPSFIVTPARDSWHCFGCGEGGDVFSFVMKRDGISFPEALRRLAERAGVEIDERSSREDARRKRLREVMEAAFAFYHSVLVNSRQGERGLAYLRGRGFADETIERFGLGWAPAGWDALVTNLARRRDIAAAELVEVGLAAPRRSGGGGAYDKFRERIVFPIRDATGNATGLGGRILPDEGTAGAGADGGAEPGTGARGTAAPGAPDRGPKYLNSPATILFDKSRTLYLVDRAKGPIRRTGTAVIVEGYTDALMAHQAGFDNVVASLGTALTPGQVALLTRYSPRTVALAYDVDPAGERAGTLGVTALGALTRELAAADTGVSLDEVRVVRLPAGQDPDEVIRDTPDAWREAVRTALPIVEALVDLHARDADLRTTGGRSRFVAALVPTLRAVRDPVLRDGYLARVRQASGVEERVLLEALAGAPRPGRRAAAATASASGSAWDATAGAGGGRITADAVLASPDAFDPRAVLRAITPVERDLLRFLLLVPETQEPTAARLTPADLPSTPARELWSAVLAQRGELGTFSVSELDGRLA